VDDVLLVGGADRVDDREHQRDRLAGARHEPRRVLRDHAVERLSVDQRHREVVLPLELAHVIDGDDVRVRDLRGRARLHEEALDLLVGTVLAAGEDLEGDDAVQLRVDRPVDDPHPPLAELSEELVLGEFRQGGALDDLLRLRIAEDDGLVGLRLRGLAGGRDDLRAVLAGRGWRGDFGGPVLGGDGPSARAGLPALLGVSRVRRLAGRFHQQAILTKND